MTEVNAPKVAAVESSGATAADQTAAAVVDGAETVSAEVAGRFDVCTYVPPAPVVQFAKRVRTGPAKRVERRRKTRRRRVIGWVMLSFGIVTVAGTAWVGWRSYQAYTHLTNAAADVSKLQGELQDFGAQDTSVAATTVAHLQDESAAASGAVNDPLYRFATTVPLIGQNLQAIREVTLTVDSLAVEVMPAMVSVSQTLQPAAIVPRDGTIDLALIQQSSAALQNADAAVQESRSRIAAIDRVGLIVPVYDAVVQLSAKLDKAASITATGARAGRLLPPMLGVQGARTYLVVFQNLAEARATGGIFGSYAVIVVDKGKVSMVDSAASRTLGQFDPAAANLTPAQVSLYTAKLAAFPQDVNFTPDFSVAAPLFAQMYQERTGTAVDGVVAMDPVALSYALKGTGPVDVGEGLTLTSENVVATLLSTAYKQFEDASSNALRDEFLAKATATAFSAVMSGQGNPATVMSGLVKAASERRLLVYSADVTEQADLADTSLSGVLSRDLAKPTIGVFLNDGTGAKLGYYLRNEVEVTPASCQPDGRRQLNVKVTMHYDAPASGLPDYVTGIGVGGHVDGPPYALRTSVMIFAPVGGGVVGNAVRDGSTVSLTPVADGTREVGTVGLLMMPGTSSETSFTVLIPSAVGTTLAPALELTPGVNAWKTSVESYGACSGSS